MTEKLYWTDASGTQFEAQGATLTSHGGHTSVVLGRTLFYPEGGGQLGDTGSLRIGDLVVAVADTQIDDAGTIHHLLGEPPEDIAARLHDGGSAPVHGTLDVTRRRDQTIQHTAQHALSRALADEARADTVSARLGAVTCTIDLSRASIPDADLHRAEDLVNAVIASNVPIRAFWPTPDELAALPLRRQPKVASNVRVIDIDGFDLTPCGGTHCARTGEIGQARIVATEKYKGMLRVTFHAGRRALVDARAAHAALAGACRDLSCGSADVQASIAKLRADLKSARTHLDLARAELAEQLAGATRAALPEGPGPHVVPMHRAQEDIAALRVLAGKLADDPRVVALAASDDPQTGELVVVVQRGASGKLDCGAFITAETRSRSGKGGGRPERAEGRFPRGTTLDVLAEAARTCLG